MAKKSTSTDSAKPKTKSEIVDHLAETTSLSKADVTKVLDELNNLITEELGKKGPGVITLPGLLKISRVWKEATKPRPGINPATKEQITIKGKPAHYAVKVKALKGLSESVSQIKKKV